jgi:hypothetical protein
VSPPADPSGLGSVDTIIPDLARPAFFDGQRLTADDLSAVQSLSAQLRSLHNRALHTWGIGFGLQATGQRGDRFALVMPGYGLDSIGRDLALAEATRLPVPAVAGAPAGGPAVYYLTASYAEDADLPVEETRDGVCAPGGAVRRPEAPRLRWQDPLDTDPASRYRRGLDVILATAKVQNCQLAASLSPSERRDARPAQQPYVAAGASTPGATEWRLWPRDDAPAGVETTVDTSAAGFGSIPRYQAQLAGRRELSPPTEAARGRIFEGFVSVEVPTRSSFVLRVAMPRNLLAGRYEINPEELLRPELPRTLQRRLGWHVVWTGVEG